MNAAGRLRRSPSPPPPARPSGRLCRRAPQQRRLPCAVGVSALLGEWGPLWPGLGDVGRGHAGGRGPRPGLPSPAVPAPRRNPPSGCTGSGGSPGKTRGALQGPDLRVASLQESCFGRSERPLQEGPLARRSSSAERVEAEAEGESWGEVQGRSSRQVSEMEQWVLAIWGIRRGMFCATTEFSTTLVAKSSTGRGSSEGGREEGALEDLSRPAHLSAPSPMTQFLGP